MAARLALSLTLALFCSAAILTFSTSTATATRVCDIRKSDTEEGVAKALAEYVANLSDKFVKERKKFTVVVAGGSLITTLRKLLEEPYIHMVDWSAWHMFWVDERHVPLNNTESNYKLAYDGFLSKVPIPSSNIYPVNTELPLDQAASDYEARIKDLVNAKTVDFSEARGFPKFDLMLLGMGPDGHVASLYQGSPVLQEKHKWVSSAIAPPWYPSPGRITFTLPVINSAANFAFVITASNFPNLQESAAAGLAENVAKGVKGPQGNDSLPIQMVSNEGPLVWFLDKPTAAKL